MTVNIPWLILAGMTGIIYNMGEMVFPLLIFMGVGALTDLPLIANPKTALLQQHNWTYTTVGPYSPQNTAIDFFSKMQPPLLWRAD